MNLDLADLERMYDDRACWVLSLPSLEHPAENVLQFATRDFLDSKKLASMRRNFVTRDDGRCEPGPCSVFSTFIKPGDSKLAEVSESICDELVKALPDSLGYFRPPVNDHHISLVMVHDLRPVDMGRQLPPDARLGSARIADVRTRLRGVSAPAYSLRLYGLRFGDDGAAMAVFIDNGETKELRRRIALALGSQLPNGAAKYPKPFIHVTLLRPLGQIRDGGVIEKLKSIQRAWQHLRDRQIDIPIDEFHLGHEVIWHHAKVEQIENYRLT